jgi:hypothetical protein
MFIINEQQTILNMRETEQEILDGAIEGFERETNAKVEIIEQATRLQRIAGFPDAKLAIHFGTTEKVYLVEIKRTVTEIALGQIAHRPINPEAEWLVVTRYVYPQMAKKMRELKIQFLDTTGNAYIDAPPALILIQAHRRLTDTFAARQEGMLGRAGVRVIFALLCKRDLWKANYRDIAKATMVALGTVAGVMTDLKQQGFLIEPQDEERKLKRRKELLEKWTIAYAERLRPKTLAGHYAANKPDFWQEENIAEVDAQWGGEVAAFRLTRYLKPEVVTIYARKPLNVPILKLKLRRDEKGTVEVRERFWNFDDETTDRAIVPPLLVYADLMATADARNIETAKMVYNDYLQRHIEQD